MQRTILATLLFFSTNGFASAGIFLHLTGGQTIAPKTNYDTNITVSGVSSSEKENDSDNSAPQFGADITFQSPFWIGVAFAAESNKYKYSDGSAADDELSLLVIPRIEFSLLMVDLWVGCGVGTVKTKFGETTSTSGTSTTTTDQSGVMGPAISPRVGVDIHLLGGLTIGVQSSFTSTKGKLTFQGKDSGTPFTGDQSFTRTWLATSLRLGYSFL